MFTPQLRMRAPFLKYELPIPMEEALDRLKRAQSALTASNSTPDDILGALLPAKIENGFVYFTSREKADQQAVLLLSRDLEQQLHLRHAHLNGVCPIRFNCFKELALELLR